MANDKHEAKGGKEAPTTGGFEIPKNHTVLNVSRSYYKPHLTKVPLQGRVIGIETFDSKNAKKGEDEQYDAAIVRLTAPTECATGVGDEVEMVPAGSDVLLSITANLGKIREYALSPFAPEIKLVLTSKKKIDGGKTVNNYAASLEDKQHWPKKEDFCPDMLSGADPFAEKQMGTGAPNGQARQLTA